MLETNSNEIPTQEEIICQEIDKLIEDKQYEKANELANEYINFKGVQSLKIKIYVKQGKLHEAIEISKKYPKNEYVQSRVIGILLNMKNLENTKRAYHIANNFPDSEVINCQRLSIICSTLFPNKNIKQSKKEKMYKRAKEIEERFPNNKFIQLEMKKIYIVRGEYNSGVDLENFDVSNSQE